MESAGMPACINRISGAPTCRAYVHETGPGDDFAKRLQRMSPCSQAAANTRS